MLWDTADVQIRPVAHLGGTAKLATQAKIVVELVPPGCQITQVELIDDAVGVVVHQREWYVLDHGTRRVEAKENWGDRKAHLALVGRREHPGSRGLAGIRDRVFDDDVASRAVEKEGSLK